MSLFEELFLNHCDNCICYHPVIDIAGYCDYKNSWTHSTGICMGEDLRKEKQEERKDEG